MRTALSVGAMLVTITPYTEAGNTVFVDVNIVACCFVDICFDLDPECCDEQGGVTAGPGTSCADFQGGICSRAYACCNTNHGEVPSHVECFNHFIYDCVIFDGGDPIPGVGCDPPVDADGDGVHDLCDPCPHDPDNDADGDGVCFPADQCPTDPNKTDPGLCGCNKVDTGDTDGDTDADGVSDCDDICPGVDDAVFAPDCEGAIPTASEWGLVVLTLLFLTMGKIYWNGSAVGNL